MKLIIYWLTLMVILPLLYLFWWKKKKRIIIGFAILAILALGIFLSEEITHSIIWRELDKEGKHKIRKLDDILKKISEQKIDAENPQEKIDQAKEIIEWNKRAEATRKVKFWGPLCGLQRNELKKAWISKWSKESFLSTLLFYGEEFNKKLIKGKYQILNENIIDFTNIQLSQQEIESKLAKIINAENWRIENNDPERFSIIWFKNIDQIKNNLELEKIFNSQQTNSLKFREGNREIEVDLLRTIFIFTISSSNPQLSEPLQAKLHHVETWENYSTIIIFFTGGLEVIIFLFLIRHKKNSKSKVVKKFDY